MCRVPFAQAGVSAEGGRSEMKDRDGRMDRAGTTTAAEGVDKGEAMRFDGMGWAV